MKTLAIKTLLAIVATLLIALTSYVVIADDEGKKLQQAETRILPYPPTRLAPWQLKALDVKDGDVIEMTESEIVERKDYESHMLIKGMIDWDKVVTNYTTTLDGVRFDWVVWNVLERLSKQDHIYRLTKGNHNKYNYEMTQPVDGGYVFQDTFGDGPTVKLVTNRTMFEGEPITKVSKLIRFDEVSKYTTVTGASKQMLVFEDVWNSKSTSDVTRELRKHYAFLIEHNKSVSN
ncbi:hypothetical protein A9Q81_19325 [Gammaproteobacteria bacterium 42_54_T18]|nr:hypothetical protein A9Q81_19325 [Gammaproteobacteria bacterium 42_54_T18]